MSVHVINTPRILIPNVYGAHNFGDRDSVSRFSLGVQITPEEEAKLPDYLKDKVSEAKWRGVEPGTRFISVSSGKIRPVIYGVTNIMVLCAMAQNIGLDRLLYGMPARLAVSSFSQTNRARNYSKGPDETWGVLRAIEIQNAALIDSFDAFLAAREDTWKID